MSHWRKSTLALSDSSLNFQILELSSNRIQVLPELLLHPLPAIESLYLENNEVREELLEAFGTCFLKDPCVVRSR